MNGFSYATSGAAAFLAVIVMACSDAPTPRTATPGSRDTGSGMPSADTTGRSVNRAAVAAIQDAHPWTHAVLDSASPGEAAVLTSVRTAVQAGFDRIVFEFAGSRAPGFHISYIDGPVRQCASGSVVPMTGDRWLQVRFVPANGHTESGRPAIPDRNRAVPLKNVTQLAQICDFEADVTWVAGVLSPNDFRVFRLEGPTRLVVDVRHR